MVILAVIAGVISLGVRMGATDGRSLVPLEPVSSPTPSTGRLDLTGKRGFWFDIVGESHYQGTLRRAAGNRLEREEEVIVRCLVVPEPNNQFDPNAIAVQIDGLGRVGYFQRDEAFGRFKALGDHLRREKIIGVCPGKLTGGWDEDISIGVRLSMLTPRELEGAAGGSAEAEQEPSLTVSVADWAKRPRVELPRGRASGLNLVDEFRCQPELRRLAGERDAATETIVFAAIIVPDGENLIVCADGGAPVGRFGDADKRRYAGLRERLMKTGAVGIVEAWMVIEVGRLGVKITLKGPKALEKEGIAEGPQGSDPAGQ